MDLSIITVTWNSRELIGTQIESVRAGCKDISYEEIIIDNASSDQTVGFIQATYPFVTVIANTENKGFAAANNQGVAIAKGDYLLFLNPDMRVEPGSLGTILAWMKQHPNVGVASPKLVDEQGLLNADATPRRWPRLWEQLALLLKIPHLFPSIMNRYLMKGFDANIEQEVDSVRGSFMLVSRAFADKLKTVWDERYCIWYEDVDLCREAKRLGYKVMHTPVITCVDYVGQSFKKRDTMWKQKNFTRSMLTYYQKWEPWYKWIWIVTLRPIAMGLAWVSDKMRI
jgi:GT2 family glycosyltransferase